MLFIFILYSLLIFIISIYLKKNNSYSNYTGDNHQIFTNDKNIPLVGGFALIIPTVLISPYDYTLSLFLISIFSIGFFSDKKILISPKLRFLFQFVIVAFSIFLLNLEITSSRIMFFDNLLENSNFNLFFTAFCLLILINGSNFIDGLNSLLVTYISIVIYTLIKLNFIPEIINYQNNISYFFIFLIILVLLNFKNLLMLGDAGAYILSFYTGYLIIKCHNFNTDVSPYFFITLIWYPCFENLFSIIRKLSTSSSPFTPDNNHLHQLFFNLVNTKIFKSKIISNNFSSLVINFFNFNILFFAAINPYNTIYQIKLILFSIVCYFLAFLVLKKINKI